MVKLVLRFEFWHVAAKAKLFAVFERSKTIDFRRHLRKNVRAAKLLHFNPDAHWVTYKLESPGTHHAQE
jgi:hypothetical protein